MKQRNNKDPVQDFLEKGISRAGFRKSGISSWSFQLSSKVVLSRVTNC